MSTRLHVCPMGVAHHNPLSVLRDSSEGSTRSMGTHRPDFSRSFRVTFARITLWILSFLIACLRCSTLGTNGESVIVFSLA